MVLPGISADRIDPALLASTDNLATAIAAAIEAGAELIEPSHLLIALVRHRDGLTRSLFTADRIPIEVFAGALRQASGPAPEKLITGWTEDAISPGTRKALAELAARAPGRPLGEQDFLAAVLTHLEPAARELLTEHGGADLDRWLALASRTALEPVALFGADGRLTMDNFTPAAQAVLANLLAEATALGHQDLGTMLLLHAMASTPHGLIEQAAVMLQFDLRELRAQLLMLLRNRLAHQVSEPALDRATIGAALRLALERAATSAAGRGARLIAERDLLAGLLDSPAGPVAAQLRCNGVELSGLRRYADHIYTESSAQAPSAEDAGMPVQESLDWFRANLIGQDHVVDRLLPRIELIKRAARRGFRLGERPLATFLFCGPSGTGKTMTARLLAKVIYGSTDDLIVFEMGQFNSRHSINNFIGAPPGYVGFGQGQLTNGLRLKPRSVLLFDEVEKADELVFDALLRLLDEGRVNDPAGPVRDARDAVVVLTSNLGAREFAELARIRNRSPERGLLPGSARLHHELHAALPGGIAYHDTGSDELAVAAQLRRRLEEFLRPELLNRLDETLMFAPFGERELAAIAALELRKRAEQVITGLGVRLSWPTEVTGHLVREAIARRPDEAARGVIRCVDEILQLVLRALDEAQTRGERLTALRVVVREARLLVERSDA